MITFYSSINSLPMEELLVTDKPIWECTIGHTWVKSISEWKRYPDCPFCGLISAGNITSGVDDLSTTHPSISKSWDYLKNKYPPEVYKANSNAKVWIDKEKQRISTWVANQSLKHKLANESVAITHPNVAASFSYNSPYAPTQITWGSSKKVLFMCNKGHEWLSLIREFIKRDTPCPYCGNREVLAGFNDLATTHPQVSKEFVGDPTTVRANQYLKAEWKCLAGGHTSFALIADRIIQSAGCPVCANKVLLIGYNDLATKLPSMVPWWSPTNTFSPQEVIAGSDKPIYILCQQCNEDIATYPYVLLRTPAATLRTCQNCDISTGEQELVNFIKTIIPNSIQHDRKILNGKELDIYCPSHKIAIEFNGVYWHSEKYRSMNYHHEKWEQAKTAGIQLIQIWEDDWNSKRAIIEKMLRHKLGDSAEEKVGARKTSLFFPEKADVKVFLEQSHIQGFPLSGKAYGLSYNDCLVAVAVVEQTKTELIITRYATSLQVVGGFTKLLKAISRDYKSLPISTFSDNEISDGHLYQINGFVSEKMLAPDYKYLVNGVRKHKFNYRKARFRKDRNLIFDETKTETELAAINNLYRCYDSGKQKWIYRKHLS